MLNVPADTPPEHILKFPSKIVNVRKNIPVMFMNEVKKYCMQSHF